VCLDVRHTDRLILRSEQPHDDHDVELLKAVAARDEAGEAALGQLYDRYRVILFSILMRILNNREEAEDVLQEVFLQVWRRAADFDANRGRPFTWLVTLARSRGIDRLRAIGSRERVVAEAGASEPSDEVSDAATDAIRSEQRGVVNSALSQLPEEQKRPLMLAYFDGLTQSEIAAQLGAPLGTVKTRMRSGMIKLRELLSTRGQYFE
jgi:RNA polymerase sigma-70 factor (ECF subfamily)